MLAIIVLSALAVVLAVAYAAFALSNSRVSQQRAVASLPPAAAADSLAAGSSVAASASVEVPDVLGISIAEARILLEAAGLEVASAEGDKAAEITAQEPAPGTVIPSGTRVVLTTASSVLADGQDPQEAKKSGLIVCIDPGHQRRSNTSPEPVGPGSKKMKPKVTGGTTGVATGLPEYEVALQISNNLKTRLEAAGVRVVMTRTTNDVDVSNAERVEMANEKNADLFVRIHCDGSPESDMSGVSVLYPKKNKWTAKIASPSKAAAQVLHKHILTSTGAVDRGLVARGDLSGFNYSEVPAVLVECGFLSNSVEDRLLASPHYQDKIAEGLSAGVVSWLASQD